MGEQEELVCGGLAPPTAGAPCASLAACCRSSSSARGYAPGGLFAEELRQPLPGPPSSILASNALRSRQEGTMELVVGASSREGARTVINRGPPQGREGALSLGWGMGFESNWTASSHTTEAETGTHSFKIVGYSLKKGFGFGKPIQSATFTVGGYDWVIRFYPDGVGEVTKEYTAVYLILLSKDAEPKDPHSKKK
ncbi:hypothetical protein C2845_PM13G06520 [Panicum miliaceum]|uniref:MATH domain-containing protein n=1 Tax=Panicum miliaceum TaxID=4540 RepID=A0A3L6RFP6_PANMI|nr:hypothetical protein C2845_PM13G06520 [Panicum miliaceum]